MLLLLLLALQAQAGSPPPSGLILGRVVDGHTAQPLSGAIVTLTMTGIAPQKVVADAEGRFVFTGLPNGGAAVTVVKSGYLPGRLGQRSPTGPARRLSIVNGSRIGDAIVRLWKPAAIGGTVYDDAGDPAVGVEVRLHERVVGDDGERVLSGVPAAMAMTDDRGVYRLTSLVPGDYVVIGRAPSNMALRVLMSFAMSEQSAIAGVAARAPTIRNIEDLVDVAPGGRIYAPAFSGAATSPAEAPPIRIRAGEERRSVDIRIRAVAVTRVAGTLIGPDGEPVSARVRLTLGDSEIEIASGTSDAEGRFTLAGVPAGPYVLRVGSEGRGPNPARGADGAQAGLTQPVFWARRQVIAGSIEAASLSIVVRRGLRIRGRVEFADASERPPPDQFGYFNVSVVPGAASTPMGAGGLAKVQPDGTFETGELAPGRYRLSFTSLSSARPWRAASITGADLLDRPIDLSTSDVDGAVITLTSRPGGTVEGTVRTPQGDADDGAIVVVLPADARLIGGLRTRTLSTTSLGVFRASDLPAGDYVVAVTNAERMDVGLDREELLRLIGVGTRITIGDGELRTVDLRSGGH
jgi:hypothetical protein